MTQPRWFPIDQDFPRTRKRLGIGTRIGQVLTGILPTVVLEQNWPEDQLLTYGINGICDFTAVGPGLFQSCSLVNTSTEPNPVEVLVWKVEASVYNEVSVQTFRSWLCHLFTPLPGYNPAAVPATIPEFFPWLQPIASGDVVRISNATMLCGGNVALPIAIVNGVPTSVIGPVLGLKSTPNAQQRGQNPERQFGWAAGPSPPLVIRPGGSLTLQRLIPTPAGNPDSLEANFYYSERAYPLPSKV